MPKASTASCTEKSKAQPPPLPLLPTFFPFHPLLMLLLPSIREFAASLALVLRITRNATQVRGEIIVCVDSSGAPLLPINLGKEGERERGMQNI